MNQNTSAKTNLFAVIALVATLGITIAGFIWLHVEPETSEPSQATPKMSLEEKVQLLDTQIDHLQAAVRELQQKVEHLEIAHLEIEQLEKYNDQVKATTTTNGR